jgi:hypothetical protein
MVLTRRQLLRGTSATVLATLAWHRPVQASWRLARHPLLTPVTCAGWWLVTPTMSSREWRDLVSGRIGTLTNMGVPPNPTSGLHLPSTRPGAWGSIAFDGTDDTVVLGTFLDNPTTLSLSCWVRYTALQRQMLLSKTVRYNGTNPGWFLRNHNSDPDGYVGFWLNQEAGVAERGAIASTTTADGLWHHVVVTMTGADPETDWTLWIDAQAQPLSVAGGTAFSTGTITSLANSEPVRLGGVGDGTDSYTGELDDVWFFTRALTPEDVRLLYEAPRTGYRGLLAPVPIIAFAPAGVTQLRGTGILFH